MRFVTQTHTFFTTDSPRHRLIWLFRAIRAIVLSMGNARGRGVLAGHIFEVFRYIWKHFPIIVILLLPVLLITLMPQGRDLILNLLHSSQEAGLPGYLVRVIWFLLMLALLAYAIWAIPRFYQEKETDDRTRARASGEPADGAASLLRAQSTSSDFLRVLAVLPLLFYGLAFIHVIRVEHVDKVIYWAINGLISVAILLYSLGFVYGWRRLRSIGWLMLGVVFLIPFGFASFLTWTPGKPEFAYAVLGHGLLMMACLLFILFHRWERVFSSPDQSKLQEFLEKWADRIYYGTLILVLAGSTILALWPNTMCMTTIPVLVFFTATYVFLIHLGLYIFMKLKASGKLVMLGLIAVVLLIFFLHPSKAHYVYLVPRDEQKPALEMDAILNAWLDHQPDLEQDSTYTIYLVAGEGGGSRAGFWTTRVLTLLDRDSDYAFADKLLALSTVSGSSAGASAWLKWRKFRKDRSEALSPMLRDSINDHLARLVFTNNFVTGSIIDLLTRDFVQSANFFTGPRRNNRNLRLQIEENLGFLQALRRQPLQTSETLRPLPPLDGDIALSPDLGSMTNYHFQPLPALWYDREGQWDYRIPLAFFNTTHMQTGRRGVVAPVRLDSSHFFHAIDVREEVEKRNGGQTLTLGVANNLSELFPVFSAFSYIDQVGNFMDGGSYENKGLTTILEVWAHLRETLDRRGLEAVNIVVLALENGNVSDNGTKWTRPVHQLPAMLSQAARQPFEAHTAAARAKAEVLLKAHPRDTILFVSLADHAPYVLKNGEPDTTRRMEFPLARDLSGPTVDSMESAAMRAREALLPILRTLDPATFSGEVKIKRDAEQN
jgi:hypothetical protein